jgi:hypothetical protein
MQRRWKAEKWRGGLDQPSTVGVVENYLRINQYINHIIRYGHYGNDPAGRATRQVSEWVPIMNFTAGMFCGLQ